MMIRMVLLLMAGIGSAARLLPHCGESGYIHRRLCHSHYGGGIVGHHHPQQQNKLIVESKQQLQQTGGRRMTLHGDGGGGECHSQHTFAPTATTGTTAIYDTSSSNQQLDRVAWRIRSATLDDAEATARVLHASFSQLLPHHYDAHILEQALPRIGAPRQHLLQCGTWYVAEHPVTRQIVGVGGWTWQAPTTMIKTIIESTSSAAESLPSSSSSLPSTQQEQQQALAVTCVPHLRHFATDPNYVRCGVGQALWNHTLREIQAQLPPNSRQEDLIMEVHSTLTALPFYASLGFKVIQQMEIPLTDTCLFPFVLMRRYPRAPSQGSDGWQSSSS